MSNTTNKKPSPAIVIMKRELATYFTNYEYLEENKPYFKLKVNATPYPEEENVSSPNLELFFSPSQLETLINVVNYEVIYAKVEELKSEAYSW